MSDSVKKSDQSSASRQGIHGANKSSKTKSAQVANTDADAPKVEGARAEPRKPENSQTPSDAGAKSSKTGASTDVSKSKRRKKTRTASAEDSNGRSLDESDVRDLLEVLLSVKKGDFATRYVVEDGGVVGRLADTLNDIIERNEMMTRELERVSKKVGEKGRITDRASVSGFTGGWRRGMDAVNDLIDDLGRPITEVERVIGAVAKGDLSQTIDLEVDGAPIQGEFRRTAKIVNTMVERLSSFASEVTRVAREVGKEGQLGGQARVKGVSGTWKDLTDNVNSMADNLTTQVRGIAEVTTAVANGDLTKKITVEAKGEILELKNTINTMVDQLSSFASEVIRVAREVGTEGKLGGQARVKGVSGTWKDLTDNVNSMADNLTTQVRGIADVTTAVANGDLTKKITVDAQGEILEVKNTINTMVDQLSSFAAEVTRVAREVGTEGQLGGQAKVKGVSGTWKDLTDNVNSMADNLTTQVRGIAEVTTAVATGDLTKKITVDAKGEIQELKNTINTMVDQLSSFASEVTRVAREVGTEGKLGGQAEVEGVSGTWKDLTDNVNSMADNLTTQVRGIAEVTTAVATGDLTKKISVDAKGEIQELKNTINTMVDQLSSFSAEVIRVAREVGTEGKLGGQAKVKGVSGTWKDLTDNVNSMADNLTTQVRGIAEVTTAVATGDLTKKITVDAKGEIQELKNTINTMVDQLSSFAAEVTRVAREVGTEGKLGGQAKVEGVSGTWKDLTDNVNSMADNLTTQVRGIAEVTTAVATGDLTKKITVDAKGEIQELKNTINTMVDQLSSFASEVTRVAREVGTEGRLGGQARVEGVSGTWKDLTDNVNSMADNLTTQVRSIAEVTTAVANGDLTKKITVDVQGEILELKETINTMVDQLSSFASEVTRVAREVGTEGKLGGQAEVKGVSGTWKDLTDNVNSMADNLTTQVRGIAEVTTAVANGDLTKKITVEAKGEIAELKNTINTMVDQLSSFASEVTRVAREVGTEGRLGGQARVEGVSGTWKDLTDNVNSMADNLTTQVRSIADVTTAVANGNLTKKITVDAKGEIAELKNTINTMVDQLSSFASEVTRVAREVGTEGKLGGQARVEGVSGTWKDLTDNVNSMANNLTTQVRGIADVVTAVARGNLKRKLSLEAKGEIAELADTINNMIDTLATFAAQVTTVAREVGVEGQLGGQAEVPGASGTWRDLVDNVNQLAANLTTQVRAITEVTTAVANGDLTKKITVEAAGEVADLKDNVNEMIRNLKETTRKNNEQDWLKTNLAKFTQLLQGQKDLKTVSKLVLSELAPLINVQHGAFYIADQAEEDLDTDSEMKLLATYAYKERKHLANRFKPGEGLVGQCLIEKERILLADVPEDYIRVSSGLGEASPYNIVVLPVLFEGKVKAVVELASFSEFKNTHLSFLDQLTESIGIVLNTLEANMRTEQLLAQSQKQQEELFYTNQRLEEKARSLQKSEEMMKRQQEELQKTNRELEDKARLLAEQKEEVEDKNQEIELARLALQEKAEQLALTSKYKSEFLANMSHELRTPLNSMLILSKMLAENRESTLSPKQVEYAETIYSSGADLLGLINEILDLSKIESGAMAVDISDVNLKEGASEIEGLFRQVAREKGLDFRIDVDEGIPENILTDKKRLQQVLKNLISNAIKFTDEGNVELHVRAAERDETFEKEVLRDAEHVIAFSVRDTGRGISEENQQIIFEAFQQADSGEARAAGGTGLGLSISREIARLLGGELDLESTLGEGSTFTFYLPDVYVPTKLARKDDGDRTSADDSPVPIEIPTLGRRKKYSIEQQADGVRRVSDASREVVPPDNSDVGGIADDVDEVVADARDADGADGAQAANVASQQGGNGMGDVQRTGDAGPADVRSSKRGRGSEAASKTKTTPVETPRRQESTEQGDGISAEKMEEVPEVSASLERRVILSKIPDDRETLGPSDRVLLVVEDDVHFAGVIRSIAHEKDFKIVVASHAEEAMMLAKRYKPSAITLDVKLPGTHGLVLLDQLKNDAETRHIPVTILSVVEDLPRHQRKGALSQMTKPVSREQVDASITQMTAFADRKIKNLLVVEDDDAERLSISELLAGDDVKVSSLNNAKAVIEALQSNRYDCAVVDLGLPDMDGYELVRRIRKELGDRNMPIVVHTGRDLNEKELDELNVVADAVIVKDVRSLNRLLHETAIFLHRSEAQMPEEARRRLLEHDTSEATLAGRKVLIVDDDIRNIFAVTSLLERHGMEILYAESGQEGIDTLVKSTDVDAVLMDIMMPGMDGYETTRTIRKMQRFKDLPIIAVTAKAMKGDREKCIEAGASDYITKPVNVEQLISILRLWVSS